MRLAPSRIWVTLAATFFTWAGPLAADLVIEELPAEPIPLLNLPGVTNTIYGLAFSRDGTRLYGGGLDKRVHEWWPRGRGGSRAIRRKGEPSAVHSRDLRWEVQRSLRGAIYALAASPSQDLLAVAGYGARDSTGDITIIDLESGDVVQSLTHHQKTVASLDFSPNGSLLCSTDLNGEVRLWNTVNWSLDEERRVEPSPGQLQSAVAKFLGNERLLVIASVANQPKTNVLTLYAIADKGLQVLKRFPLGEPDPGGIAVGRGNDRWAYFDMAGGIHLYQGAGSLVPIALTGRRVLAANYDARGRLVLLTVTLRKSPPEESSPETRLELWDPDRNETLDEVRIGGRMIEDSRTCAISPDGNAVAVYGGIATGILYYPLTNEAGEPLKKPFTEPLDREAIAPLAKPVVSLAFSPENPRLIRFQAQGQEDAREIDLTELDGIRTVPWVKPLVHEDWSIRAKEYEILIYNKNILSHSIPLNPSSQGPSASGVLLFAARKASPTHVAIGTRMQCGIFLYRLEGGGKATLVRYYRDHHALPLKLAVSVDGKLLASAGLDGMIKIWSLAGLEPKDPTFPRSIAWGARFVIEGERVVVKNIEPAGIAASRGLEENDAITAVITGGGHTDGAGKERVKIHDEPQRMIETLANRPLAESIQLMVQRDGQNFKDPFLFIPAWEPLMTLYPGDAGQWAAWTPSGYFAASLEGQEYFGWQSNWGRDKTPRFYQARHFCDTFERPDLLRAVIETGSFPAALKRTRMTSQATLEDSVASTPVIRVLYPKEGDQAPDQTKKARILVEFPRPGLADKFRFEAYLNTAALGVGEPAGADSETAREFTWNLPPQLEQQNHLFVVAIKRDQPVFQPVYHAGASFIGPDTPASARLFYLALAVDKYSRDALQFAVEDVEALRASLRQGGLLRLDPTNERILPDDQVTRGAVDEAIQWLEQREPGPADLLVVCLCGHGMVVGGKYYFVTQYADLNKLLADGDQEAEAEARATCVSWDSLERLLELRCRKILLLDTCHAGAIKEQALTSLAERTMLAPFFDRHIAVFAACASGEAAAEGGGHGLFTRHLLDGLGGAAQANKDPFVDLFELAQYTGAQVAQRSAGKQHPTIWPRDLPGKLFLPLVKLRAN